MFYPIPPNGNILQHYNFPTRIHTDTIYLPHSDSSGFLCTVCVYVCVHLVYILYY